MNPYIAAGLVAVLFSGGFFIGTEFEASSWRAREIATAKATQGLIQKAREKERTQQASILSLSSRLNKELSNAKSRSDSLRASVRLYLDPASCGGLSTTAGGSRGNSSAACLELPRPAVEFLLSLTNEADQVALQLSTCQQILILERQNAPSL